jgi:hypothetical protein
MAILEASAAVAPNAGVNGLGIVRRSVSRDDPLVLGLFAWSGIVVRDLFVGPPLAISVGCCRDTRPLRICRPSSSIVQCIHSQTASLCEEDW